MRKVIVNATPLIALCHVKRLSLLQELYGEIVIPKAVYDEIAVKEDSVCKIEVERSWEWIKIQEVQKNIGKQLFKSQLHAGEVEVMLLAMEQNGTLFSLCKQTVGHLDTFTKLLTSVFAVASAAAGRPASAVATAGAAMLFSDMILTLSNKLFLPAVTGYLLLIYGFYTNKFS